MKPFSIRNKTRSEHSGYESASKNLRNRVLSLYGHPYSGDEFHFGVGNTDWIHERALSKDLQMHFGRKIPIEDFRDELKTSYDEFFDYVELYYARAKKDLGYEKRESLYHSICEAFINSGSVYEFSQDGNILLVIDESLAEKITKTDTVLKPIPDAQNKFRNLVDGLIHRSIDPADAVGDVYIVFEDYCKKKSRLDTFEKSFIQICKLIPLHPIQIQIMEKLKAYRGDVWGSAHAGKGDKPGEAEALWYLEAILNQIKYLESKLEK